MELIAKRLNPGDCIGVVSPSNPVVEVIAKQYNTGIRRLHELGYQVIEGKHIHTKSWGYAASPQEKAEDINAMFANPQVNAIMCTEGGITANACLPYLDLEIITNNPKIFIGISDITVLLNSIHAKTGLITFHGADVIWGFGNDQHPYELEEFNQSLHNARMEPIPNRDGAKCIRPGKATGKLLGGNINCLLKLVGTPYWPNFSGAILAIEAIGVPAASFDHMFQQLKQMGLFDQINGIITGFIDGTDNNKESQFTMEEVLLRIVEEFHFPILKTNNFGHNCPNTTLPIGAMMHIDADNLLLQPVERYLT